MSIFEVIMLLCFGSAWPVSIYKSIKSKTTGGKSLFFLIIIAIGYVSGTIHKILFSKDWVMFLYILNFCMVAFDILLYFRNKKRENVDLVST